MCEKCGQPTRKWVYLDGQMVCPDCKYAGQRKERATAIIRDEIPGGFVQENFGPKPEVFYSKADMARRAKELGLEPMVRHIGNAGSDKSSQTTRWY